VPTFQTLDELDLQGKIVLVRADLNVPMKDGHVTDNTRLVRFLPTLVALQEKEAKIVILSHFGRPKGKRNEDFSLRPVVSVLNDLVGKPIAFAEDCVGEAAQKAVQKLQAGQILVLENTRFHPEEEANDPTFAKEIAALGDAFINDAFSAAHRAHATTASLADLLPAAAGKLMQEELEALGNALEHPQKPLGAIIGGAKISTKLDLLHNLIKKVDLLVLGGGMANTFLAAQGFDVGKSLFEPEMVGTTKTINSEAEALKCKILLPKDVVIASELKEGAETQIVAVDAVPKDSMILDIGPQSIAETRMHLAPCCTIIWNGPLGVFETPPFDRGTNEIAQAVADLTKESGALSVAGGGDTLAALAHAGVAKELSYISTAGGAFLEWLEGKTLPGIAALEKAANRARTS